MVLSNQTDPKCTRIGKSVFHDDRKRIFDRVGIVLHGKHSFCTKLAAIIKVKIMLMLIQFNSSYKI